MIDFRTYCSVLFFFENEKGNIVSMHYERPQFIDDYMLTKEAHDNARDMISKRINGAQRLEAIAIARSEEMYNEILKQASEEF